MGQCTKSLRSSPLRGSKSREAGSRLRESNSAGEPRPENRGVATSLRMELPMSETNTVSPLRHRMIEDMTARKLNPHTQRGHISSCKRFAAWLKRSPDTATHDDVRFQLHLIESGESICTRNRIMTGVGFCYIIASPTRKENRCVSGSRGGL